MIFSRLKDYYLALGSFVLVLGITLYAYNVSKESDKLEDTKTFEIRSVQIKSALERRMGHYLQILKSVNGLFAASDTVSRTDFQQFLGSLQIEKTYPGIQGIGFAVMLPRAEVPALEQRMRATGIPDFEVNPKDFRDDYSSVIFLEPMDDRNRRALGFDMFNEPTRREAMEAARDFNLPAMTGKVKLVQENGGESQVGLLIYMPVYYGGADPGDVAERRRRLKGFVYAPFRAKDLIDNTINHEARDMNVTIYDGKEARSTDLIYQTEVAADSLLDTSGKALFIKDVVRVAGRTWTIHFKPSRSFSNQNGIDEHNLILLGGLIISLLIFFVVWTLQRYLQSNQLTELITNNTTAGLFMLDSQGYCTFQNPAGERLLGYNQEELRRRPLYELVHRKQDAGDLAPDLVTQKSYTFEDTFICRSGKSIPVSCSIRHVKEGNKVVGHILEVRDITEEKRAQRDLQESEARFRNMADSAPVMIWITDHNRDCLYMNRQWLQFTGSTLEDNLNKGWLKYIHPEDLKHYEEAYVRARREKEDFMVEYRLLRADGVYRGVMATGSPRYSAEGEFKGFIGSVIDISDRIKMEQKLKQSADTLQKIFMQVPAIVGLVKAKNLEYTLVNAYLSNLYGEEAKVGTVAIDSLPTSQRSSFAATIEKIKETGEPFIGNEVAVHFDEEGSDQQGARYFNIVYEPIKNSQGEVESVLTFAVEVTEQVRSREQLSFINGELNRKNKELTRINNDLDSFVYTASHDLRSPLANLEGLTDALLENIEEKADTEEATLLRMVASSITKLKSTIHDLTEITKVQKDLESQAEELSFEEVLEGIKEDIAPMIKSAGVVIASEFHVPQLRYARKNLRSILYNLVSNAVKYRDPSRPLELCVKTKTHHDFVVLTVEDNGLGIRADQQEKLFTMFRRFHSHVEGTGIGLYIVKRIIENNGGYIEVDSQEGRGSTFTVYFKEMELQDPQEQDHA
ncbi:CHASE domain-containing protein [Rufibacter sp. LB8]|uniref:CHASE domain-containing protein n=1 Tax=Rufibacter sp. LB8 TaxID=2777781 RepID=UPI00178C70FA|nr:CHASE domain-containing protein [Rufibacter sp. LB8]